LTIDNSQPLSLVFATTKLYDIWLAVSIFLSDKTNYYLRKTHCLSGFLSFAQGYYQIFRSDSHEKTKTIGNSIRGYLGFVVICDGRLRRG
jgi:hypothetical protein